MLSTPEAVAIGAFLASLNGSNLPIRRPSWNRPAFWSRPLMQTLMRPIPAGTDWTDFLSVSGKPQYVATVTHYAATSVGNIAIAGLEFRMLLDGNPLPLSAVTLAAGVELNKKGPNTYPIVPRKLFQVVLEKSALTIQVRNPTALQREAVAAFWGWYYEALDSQVFSGTEEGIVDAIYRPIVGGPYG